MGESQLLPVDPRPRGPAHRHVHRRSAAMSSHDLSGITGILQPKSPNVSARGNSAPSSPSLELNQHFSFPISYDTSTKTEADDTRRKSDTEVGPRGGDEETPSPLAAPEPGRAAQRRSFNRVGFSDTLEFIPRPLSLVSSDTSSITIRPGHSVSNSISSIISLSNSVIEESDERFSPLEASPSHATTEFRPSTAGAILERTESSQIEDPIGVPRRRGSLPLLTDAPMLLPVAINSPEPSPTKAFKRWSFFGLEPSFGSHSPTRSRPVSQSSSEGPKSGTPATSSERVSNLSNEVLGADSRAQRPASRKSSKKQKKVKTWAGSILMRKPKSRYGKSKKASRRAPTPPPSHLPDDDNESGDDSADTKSEPGLPTVFITELDQAQGGPDTWKAPRPATEDDTAYPMIDLDAALGPFNTPLPRNAEWEAAQNAGGLVKRQLHSAAGMSRFTGPGMHYVHHQRAQSSPEMAPFEARRGIHKFGSTSTMADVFEEDEEDDDEDSDISGKSTPQAEQAGIKGAEASIINGYFAPGDLIEKTAGSDLEEEKKSLHSASMKSQVSSCSLQEQVIVEEPADYPFRPVEFGRQSDNQQSSESPTWSPISPKGKDLALVETDPFCLQSSTSLAPISPYSVTASSSFPSPRSPVSYDANIISTAPSSVANTEDFQSLLMGEPGPEVRLSVDIPSLTSSNSTMTRESISAQQATPPARRTPAGERPASASFASAAFSGRRGSLASLSRLISSSHGERSKLSMEVSYNSDTDKKNKGSKSRRFSRMMQFWKPSKENAEA